MQSLSGNNTTASYTYDEQGVRSSKTVNGVTTTFHYNGSLLMAQVQGSGASQVKQLYSYDASGDVISVNYNGTEYYYLRNGQNDVVGLMDASGNRVVEYTYDAWGKLISTTGTLATSLGADNPFRYRGYYYDTETGLYYLMTRYYDPEICRFISADVYMSTGQGVLGGNMWAYCLNNPTIYIDNVGTFVNTIIGGFIGGIVGGITAACNGDNFWAGVGIGAATGALAGLAADVAIATGGVGAIAIAAVGGAIASGSNYALTEVVNGREVDGGTLAVEATVGAAFNVLTFGVGGGSLKKAAGSTVKSTVSTMKNNLSNAIMANTTRKVAGVTVAKSIRGIAKNVAKNIIKETITTVIITGGATVTSNTIGRNVAMIK